MTRAYLCVSIATVSDEDRRVRPRRPRSFEGITDGIVRRIHPFFERFGAKPTYLLSRDVLLDPACLDTFRALSATSELGTHLDDRSAEDAPRGPESERDQLTEMTDLFIRAFGHQPQSFRGPHGLGSESARILESLGYAVDSSVTPDVDGGRETPTQPYVLDPTSPARPGASALLEVPVTFRRRPLAALPMIGRRIAPRSLRPAAATTAALVRLAEDEIAAARSAAPQRPVVLHAMLRNVDVVPWASPGGTNEEEARGVLDCLRALLVLARAKGISVVGLADVPEILRR